MRVLPRVVHFHDGVSVAGNIRSSVSVSGKGGAHKVDEIEATPVGLLVKGDGIASLVPWGSVKSCPDVEVIDDKPGKAGK